MRISAAVQDLNTVDIAGIISSSKQARDETWAAGFIFV